MDPYLYAAGTRGESFRVDDIDDLDQFAAENAQIKTELKQPRKITSIQQYIIRLLKISGEIILGKERSK